MVSVRQSGASFEKGLVYGAKVKSYSCRRDKSRAASSRCEKASILASWDNTCCFLGHGQSDFPLLHSKIYATSYYPSRRARAQSWASQLLIHSSRMVLCIIWEERRIERTEKAQYKGVPYCNGDLVNGVVIVAIARRLQEVAKACLCSRGRDKNRVAWFQITVELVNVTSLALAGSPPAGVFIVVSGSRRWPSPGWNVVGAGSRSGLGLGREVL